LLLEKNDFPPDDCRDLLSADMIDLMRLSSRVAPSKYEDYSLRLSREHLLLAELSLIIELLAPDPAHHSQIGEGRKTSLLQSAADVGKVVLNRNTCQMED
jgi:hypothetical protein